MLNIFTYYEVDYILYRVYVVLLPPFLVFPSPDGLVFEYSLVQKQNASSCGIPTYQGIVFRYSSYIAYTHISIFSEGSLVRRLR